MARPKVVVSDKPFRPRPIKRGSEADIRLKIGKLNATKRSLQHLRRHGWTVDVAERFVTHGRGSVGGYRRDLFGFIDLLAFRGNETVAVQTTSFQLIARHLRSFRENEELRAIILDWIAGENRSLVFHGWRCMEVGRVDGRGTKAEWQLTDRVILAADMPPARGKKEGIEG